MYRRFYLISSPVLKHAAQQEQPLRAVNFDRGTVEPHHAGEGPMHGKMRISRPFELAVVYVPGQVASSGGY